LEWLQFVLAPQMINGLSIGVAVVLMALGLTIIFGLLDVINMAHGEFYAIGAYLAVVPCSVWACRSGGTGPDAAADGGAGLPHRAGR
jgi:branched-subunit amino acid ABC-type transport system permease component